ncbi:hypothetical protein ACN08P_18960 [Photobacterium leiognathi subsp. mandapamensis]|uniref:hypothetical protein n=1 Tax=Photobacterium leiognathi TaxID=553611 RepID=UPI003AF3ED6F
MKKKMNIETLGFEINFEVKPLNKKNKSESKEHKNPNTGSRATLKSLWFFSVAREPS